MSDTSRQAPGSPRDRLLQAAREVVAADGLEGLTLRAIARRAGVSHGAPLRHFPTLASLLAAVAADGFARLVATVDEHLAEAERAAAETGTSVGPRRRLAVAGEAYVRFALDDPGVFSVTFRPERVDVTDAAYQAEGMRSFGQLVDLVTAAQADGWHPAERPEVLAAVLWAHVHGLAVLTLHGALPGVVGADEVGRLPALSSRLTLGDDAVSGPDPHQPHLAGRPT
ncbi:MAG TPA: TetR/AcrR family transcriptional regulator [Ornithinibacter sp.]|nr:TetR/AcrR family transcriptional regulator [Ornithinibacter sp.]